MCLNRRKTLNRAALLAALSLLLFSPPLQAAESLAAIKLQQSKPKADSINSFAMWTPVYGNLPIFRERYRLYLEAQTRIERTSRENFTMAQLRLRTALGYKFNRSLAAYAGFAWCPDFNPYRGEVRPYQDLLYGNVLFDKIQMAYRYRSEERFIEHVHGMSYRSRYKIRAAMPLGETSWYAIASDEIFLTFNQTRNGPHKGFDQYRLYGGLGRQINPHLRVETGYLLRHSYAAEQKPNHLDHALRMRFLINY
ncbi:MAG: DUF2490 domain-containing protein [Candidatus Obscuribacterales bacterium]